MRNVLTQKVHTWLGIIFLCTLTYSAVSLILEAKAELEAEADTLNLSHKYSKVLQR
jgi:hypothetical protein